MGQRTEMKLSHQNQRLVFEGRRKPGRVPGQKQRREPANTQPTYDARVWESNPEASILITAPSLLSESRSDWLYILCYRVFSRDFTAAMLVSLNKETAAMLVYPTYPLGIELYYHANVFFCFGGKTRLLITRVKFPSEKLARDLRPRIL